MTEKNAISRSATEPTDRVTASPATASVIARMKMRHLDMLKNIERYGSLTRVAQETGISQPAVTKTLAEIESLFGAPLFTRSGRGLIPTDMGKLAMLKSGRMLRELHHWASEMEAVRKGHSARLLIGAVPYVSGSLLTQAITRLYERHNIIIAVQQATTDHLLQSLCDHELDCVLGRASAMAGRENLWHEVLYVQRPVLIGHNHLLERLGERPLDWRTLATMKWILPSLATPVGAKMAELFTQEQVPVPLPIIETYSIDIMHGVLSTNESVVSVVPEDIALDMVRRGGVGILPWKMDWELPPLSLIRRVRDMPVDAEDKFAEILKELCNQAYFATK
ncbi:LysR substrate-binding domain-containing protein [Pusillimonas sp. SM2304]|uniref:LysR substrate-binding domain-containing protein n=1 Tax=Pusillimonas sp. SM2304 TaxID=3073241 RepID=UPI0028748A75|nr:LysR substrate-binding domain-containing protein [Pusillimonas sp. SM2304]MDS1139413.1 LysR substrate-binding domain-containing protein [Pusillimonas sp. SM2304]